MPPPAARRTGRQTRPRLSATLSAFPGAAPGGSSRAGPVLSGAARRRGRRGAGGRGCSGCGASPRGASGSRCRSLGTGAGAALRGGARGSGSPGAAAAGREEGSPQPLVLLAGGVISTTWGIQVPGLHLSITFWLGHLRVKTVFILYGCSLAGEESNTKIYFLEFSPVLPLTHREWV